MKNKNAVEELNGLDLTDDEIKDYNLSDEFGSYKQGATLMRTGEAGARIFRPKGYYPIYVRKYLSDFSIERKNEDDYEVFPETKDGKAMSWRRSKEYLMKAKSEIIIKENKENISFYKKQRLVDDMKNGKKAKTLFYKPEYSSGNGTALIKKLFNNRLFDHPKPHILIKDFIKIGSSSNSIILDLFSGSATTSHAVMQLNAEENGKRKFIMVQLPEVCDEQGEAFKAGYKNVCEIGKERTRRAGEKVLKENKEKEGIGNLDIGFKVFKLDSSNIKKWNADGENLEISIENMIDNFVPNRTQEDIVYEIMIKYGIDLTYPLEIRNIVGKKVFSVGFGALFICIDNEITLELVQGIVKFKDELNPEVTRVVFKDNGFQNDSVKANAIHILRRNKIQEIMSI
ncbi:DNA methyltransferase [Clostridium psychrophilum]|uniref:DNA methyltransferase n=1 Tax=Clostridium psychrophilum TaxID=132926 RepID=UPI002484AA3C|nr:DNA methyltransferase [Clostridium psychrophilum]